MSWGTYFMFYDCPQCGEKYRWSLEDMGDKDFAQCPSCHAAGTLVGETKELGQGDTRFADYRDV